MKSDNDFSGVEWQHLKLSFCKEKSKLCPDSYLLSFQRSVIEILKSAV
ncbi:hypothetical protein CLONEX_02541 [[Clostridium] nexile DSM 1787]|nr:hypothetical protein CLONEX_02541 [[Clostridium] nexile DSM 1787]